MSDSPMEFGSVTDVLPDICDHTLVLCASPEERCLGVVDSLGGARPRRTVLLEIVDEPNSARVQNIERIVTNCGGVRQVERVRIQHKDPVFGIDALSDALEGEGGVIACDISTFPRNTLLLSLRATQRAAPDAKVTILYSEPSTYSSPTSGPLGMRGVAAVPSFAAPYQARDDLVLIVFLGYEGERALGLWQAIEPNRTIAVAPRPAYRDEMAGEAERKNSALLAALAEDDLFVVDARNPVSTYRLLKSLWTDDALARDANVFIAPLGTKPEVVGMYSFCRDHEDAATIVYAGVIDHDQTYLSRGVGRKWLLPFPERSDCG